MKKILSYSVLYAYRLTMFAPIYMLVGYFTLGTGIGDGIALGLGGSIALAAEYYALATLLPLICAAWFKGRWRLIATLLALAAYCAAGMAWLGSSWPRLLYIALNIFAWLSMAHIATLPQSERYNNSEMIWGVALHLLAPIIITLSGQDVPYALFTWAGSIFLVLCVFILNDSSVRDGMALRGQGKPVRQLSRVNRWLAGVIAALALIVANFQSLRDWVYGVFSQIGHAIAEFIGWLMRLFQSDTAAETPMSGGESGMLPMGAEEHIPQWWEQLVEYILRGIALLVVAAFACFLLYKLYKGLRKLIRLIQDYAGRYANTMRTDYQDEQESLMDWGELTSEWKDSAAALLGRFRNRDKRWSDMDNRERVRFTLRSLYRKHPGTPRLAALSAREALNEMSLPEPAQAALADIYDRARYSEHEISAADVECAQTAATAKVKEKEKHRSDSDIII